MIEVTGATFPKICQCNYPTWKREKYCPMQHQSTINENKQNTENIFSYKILCPLCHLNQRKHIKTKFTQLRIQLNVACQVHIVGGKKLLQNLEIWFIKSKIQRWNGISNHALSEKKVSKTLRQKLVDWITKNSNVHESTIAHDNLLITDAEYGVKRRVPKLLLECSMQQLHNEIIASPDDGCLLVDRNADTNDVIISDTMICSLAPPQLLPMTHHHKIMCGCAIYNISNHMMTAPFQTMKLVIHIAKMQQILFFVNRLMMNVNLPIGNVYCGSVLLVLLLLSHESKEIHQTEHQWLRLIRIWLNLLVHIMAF